MGGQHERTMPSIPETLSSNQLAAVDELPDFLLTTLEL
jgi:hypothetical protein